RREHPALDDSEGGAWRPPIVPEARGDDSSKSDQEAAQSERIEDIIDEPESGGPATSSTTTPRAVELAEEAHPQSLGRKTVKPSLLSLCGGTAVAILAGFAAIFHLLSPASSFLRWVRDRPNYPVMQEVPRRTLLECRGLAVGLRGVVRPPTSPSRKGPCYR